MSTATASIVGTGAQAALTKDRDENVVVFSLGGTYGGIVFTVEASVDGTNYAQVAVIDNKTGNLIAGGTSISPNDNSAGSWTFPLALGFALFRLNVSAWTSGTGAVTMLGMAMAGPSLYSSIAGAAGSFTNLTTTGTISAGGETAPTANDGAALGDATHNWSDLFLASGAVINYANGNVVVTHTSGVLTMGTGDFRITTAGTNAASVVTVGGTQTLTNKTLTSPTFTAPVLGVATGTSLAVTGLLTSSSPSAGIGYATGAGSTVTQGTSRTTGVTINALSGAITLFSAAGQAGKQSFTVTNSSVAATDTIILNQKSGTDLYDTLQVTNVAAGSFKITFANSAGTTTEQPVFNFNVIKGVTS